VRVLLDECIDWRMARHLDGHVVKTARQMGWTTIKNGELLALASAQFDAFVTVDRNLSFQQNLTSLTVAVLVLCAKSNRLSDLMPLIPQLVAKLATIQPGSVTLIEKADR
jgi:predicted nuclease of predicted toxin-antitoxin system